VALGNPRSGGDSGHPGEPGVGPDLNPPFVAHDEATRWLFSLNRFGIRPGLARVQGLLTDLGNPENHLRTLVCAGTNGKGSTTRILSLLLQAAGYRVATYTSPHLLNVHERIMINDRPVDASVFAARVEAIKPLVEKHEASWFETLTALAVQIAGEEKVDFLCCETGLGGRLDASNALPATATLLTTIGLDHQRILGDSLEQIAAEKLGLLKKGVPLFCGVGEDLRSQAFTASVLAGSPCHFLDELARWQDSEPAGHGSPETWDLVLREKVFPGLPDPGTLTMRRNVALAILALSELESSLEMDLLPADPAVALGNLFLPGRYQTVLRDPDWIFDTAHNAQALENVWREFLGRPGPGRKVVVFGAMYDKDLPADPGDLLDACDALIGVPVSLPRSRTADELEELFRMWGREPAAWSDTATDPPSAAVAPDIPGALRFLSGRLKPEDTVLVTGSCFTVAEILYRLGFADLEATRIPQAAAQVLGTIGEG
jgi:dihydrofolate synthase/folylpolyglutamate synthase